MKPPAALNIGGKVDAARREKLLQDAGVILIRAEVEASPAEGARPSGRFEIHRAGDSRTPQALRPVKRRERRAPTAGLWPRSVSTSAFGFSHGWNTDETRTVGGKTDATLPIGFSLSALGRRWPQVG
ncbi:MAG: hypothetical protein HZA89_03885 [Verrucomicrobia bacterium]|nr:hypothetical protein [Verrucomicrobiota bacterium]